MKKSILLSLIFGFMAMNASAADSDVKTVAPAVKADVVAPDPVKADVKVDKPAVCDQGKYTTLLSQMVAMSVRAQNGDKAANKELAAFLSSVDNVRALKACAPTE